MSISAEEVNNFAKANGADLVGVAPADAFDAAPPGHRPSDILSGAKSVIACAKRIPRGVLYGPATSYQATMTAIHAQLDLLAMQVALFVESSGGKAVPVPSDEPYRHWEPERKYGRGDLSHKHAAQAAGLGKLGRNSLLITPEFGNRVHLVSVVSNVELGSAPVKEWDPCPRECQACLRACPAGAIGETQQVDQARCRAVMIQRLAKGALVEGCWACRKACPVGRKQDSHANRPA